MRSKLILIAVLVLAIAVGGCTTANQSPAAPPQAQPDANARNNLDWAGVYQGVVPSAGGMGIKVQLVLSEHQTQGGTFELTYEYLEGEQTVPEIGSAAWAEWSGRVGSESGTFEWDETGNVIRLDVANWPPYYRVGENIITQLDMSGNLITGALAEQYVLTKVG